MTVDQVLQLANEALFTIIKTSAPLLLTSLVVGLLISIFQTVTSIQEQTMTFVPKILAVFLIMIVLGNWMIGNVTTMMINMWSDFSVYIR